MRAFALQQAIGADSLAYRLARSSAGGAGATILLIFIAMACLAPVLSPYDPIATDWSALRQAPSAAHWMGTDDLGRDVLSRVIWGSRASLLVGVLSVAIAMVIGVPLGLISGYAGGVVDGVLMRITDGLLAIPSLILAIALAAFLGASLLNAMIAIGIAAAPIFIRLTRGQVLVVRGEQYVDAVRTMGFSGLRIVGRHVLPNILPVLLVQATLSMADAIIAEAGLSFLGLGQQPPDPSWGAALDAARSFIVECPWMSIWPGVFICISVFGLNLLGDGLRDALDPRNL
ncbi:MAG TPA: ABC transporter permease [Dongiaceae bacterium]